MSRATINAQDLLLGARADGLRLRADGDKLVVQGDPAIRARWRPVLTEAKPAILELLTAAANDSGASATPPGSCQDCRHVSGYGNCERPVMSGLAGRFMLVKHPAGGAGCTAFQNKPLVIETRLSRLLAIGAIDADDADLCRVKYADDSAMWDLLLDACERAVRDGRPKKT